MSESSSLNDSQLRKAALAKVAPVYRRLLGYKPERMKTVHFATSFLLCLTGSYRALELLNKASNPKAVPKGDAKNDHYFTPTFLQFIQDLDTPPISPQITENELVLLRNHLHNTFNNDGAALAAAFKPHKTHGFDFTTPSPLFLANGSKNHGNAGALVYCALKQSDEGNEFLSLARSIFDSSNLPSSALGLPFVQDEPVEYQEPESLLADEFVAKRLSRVAHEMDAQTRALLNLARNLQGGENAYALRQLVIGVASWLIAYMIKIGSGSDAIVFADFCGGTSPRVRAQAQACYTAHISAFGGLVSRTLAKDEPLFDHEDRDACAMVHDGITTVLEDHFNDFVLRSGWTQPRSGTSTKHFEMVPDTLRVLLLSILEADEILTMDEVAERLLTTWRICIGLVPSDHALLRKSGYSPLDHSADLRANREHFKNLSVALGLAREPSDGLVLFSIGSELA
jgi:hypothetical protein